MAIDDRDYLSYQYSDADKYLTRVDTHRKYSEIAGSFSEWVLGELAAVPGSLLLDVGCGPGIYHPALHERGVHVVGADLFSGMLATAGEGRAARALVRATAEALPFANQTFDYVMANHMLYHVKDQRMALLEMRRVARPGARVLLTTNASDNMRRLRELHDAACLKAGLRSTSDDAPSRFTLEDTALIGAVFPDTRVVRRKDALVFRAPEPLLRFYASFMIDYVDPLPGDGRHRPLLLAAMDSLVRDEIAREGEVRIPKDSGCFVADV
jgi:SAM-dependent methyltransferase